MKHTNDISPDLEQLLQELPVEDRPALAEAWGVAGDAPPVPAAVRDAVWSRVVQATKTDLGAPARRPRLRLVAWPTRQVFAVAASILLFVAVGFGLRPTESSFEAPAGQTLTVDLRDGSTVTLSPGSHFSVSHTFGSDDRIASLDGEAFFDVASSSENGGLGFEVHTFNASIEVVGTAFNVRARRSDVETDTRVTVDHGAVRVASATMPDLAVLLEAGEETLVSAQTTPADAVRVDPAQAFSWRNGGLAFDDAPMGAVFDEIERLYDLRIDAPPAIRRMQVSYWRESSVEVDAILADLADVIDAQIRRTANGFQVFQADQN